MKLPEFITYCTLKNLIVTHEKLDPYWPRAWTETRKRNDYYKIVVENDNYLATITYGKDDSRIVYSRLTKVSVYNDEHMDQACLGTIMSKFV